MDDLITLEDIEKASIRLTGQCYKTPLLEYDDLNTRVGGRVLIKAECLQRTGSFKFRGAYNRLSALSATDRKRGVVAFSSGNHAKGVAAAAHKLGISAKIVMPQDAPESKVLGTENYGGHIIFYDRYTENRERIAEQIARDEDRIIVPSFDDSFIMAGQGTVGLEAAKDMIKLGVKPDQGLICCGGGGLASGSFLALKSYFPSMAAYIVEPEAFDDTARSLKSGFSQSVKPGSHSICDALLSSKPGEKPFALLKELDAEGLTVSDQQVLNAISVAFHDLKLVVEPGGSVALAALLSGKVPTKDKTTLIVISGGNIDAAMLSNALAAYQNGGE